MRPLDAWSAREDCSGQRVRGAVACPGGIGLVLDGGAVVVVERGWIAAGDEAQALLAQAKARLARHAAELAALDEQPATAREEARQMRRAADLASVVFGDGLDIIGLGTSDVDRRARTERLMREVD